MLKNILYSTAICTTLAALPLSLTTTQAYATDAQTMPNPFQQGSGMARVYDLSQQIKRNKNLDDAQELLELLCTGGAYRIDDERNFVKVQPNEERTIFGIRNDGPNKTEWDAIVHALHYASQVEGMEDYVGDLWRSIQNYQNHFQGHDVRIKGQTAGVFVLYGAIAEPYMNLRRINSRYDDLNITQENLNTYVNRHGKTLQEYKNEWEPQPKKLSMAKTLQQGAAIAAFPKNSDAAQVARDIGVLFETVDEELQNPDGDSERSMEILRKQSDIDSYLLKRKNKKLTVTDTDFETIVKYINMLSQHYSRIKSFVGLDEDFIKKTQEKRKVLGDALKELNYDYFFNTKYDGSALHPEYQQARQAVENPQTDKEEFETLFLERSRKFLSIHYSAMFEELVQYADALNKVYPDHKSILPDMADELRHKRQILGNALEGLNYDYFFNTKYDGSALNPKYQQARQAVENPQTDKEEFETLFLERLGKFLSISGSKEFEALVHYAEALNKVYPDHKSILPDMADALRHKRQILGNALEGLNYNYFFNTKYDGSALHPEYQQARQAVENNPHDFMESALVLGYEKKNLSIHKNAFNALIDYARARLQVFENLNEAQANEIVQPTVTAYNALDTLLKTLKTSLTENQINIIKKLIAGTYSIENNVNELTQNFTGDSINAILAFAKTVHPTIYTID